LAARNAAKRSAKSGLLLSRRTGMAAFLAGQVEDLSSMARRSVAVNPLDAPSFRDGPKDQTRNLEIPDSMLRIAPE
jgi:hypothetical protein